MGVRVVSGAEATPALGTGFSRGFSEGRPAGLPPPCPGAGSPEDAATASGRVTSPRTAVTAPAGVSGFEAVLQTCWLLGIREKPPGLLEL